MSNTITDIPNSEALACLLRDARKNAGMRQEEAARLINVPRTTFTAIEQGKRHLRLREWLALTRGYGVDPDELLGLAKRKSSEVEWMEQLNPEQKSVILRLLQAEPGAGAMQAIKLMSSEMSLAGIEDVACALPLAAMIALVCLLSYLSDRRKKRQWYADVYDYLVACAQKRTEETP